MSDFDKNKAAGQDSSICYRPAIYESSHLHGA